MECEAASIDGRFSLSGKRKSGKVKRDIMITGKDERDGSLDDVTRISILMHLRWIANRIRCSSEVLA